MKCKHEWSAPMFWREGDRTISEAECVKCGSKITGVCIVDACKHDWSEHLPPHGDQQCSKCDEIRDAYSHEPVYKPEINALTITGLLILAECFIFAVVALFVALV